MLRGEVKVLDRGGRVGESVRCEVVGDAVDVVSTGLELSEVEAGGGVGDDIEAGAGGECELFGVAAGEGGDEVVFGVVDVLAC